MAFARENGDYASPLTILGAASSAGAYGPGQELAPRAFRRHGLAAAVRARGRDVVDHGDVVTAMFQPDPDSPRAGNVDAVVRVARSVADGVAPALEAGHDVLVLGGDCTVELGTVAGARRDDSSVGLVYIDLDADLNTPATGDGILDWMGVAHLLGVEGAEPRLAGIGPATPLLEPDGLVLMACDRATEAEQAVIDRLCLRRETSHHVSSDLSGVLERTTAWAQTVDRVLVHVDADVLDFASFPIAENTRRVPGLAIHELAALLRGCARCRTGAA